ncbi:unnamed protein product [Brassica rapa]|uniref:Uncharacterized protein n=1 Tax=Brassica campestris TaxID=3711 RepID=A0A8D9DAK4_BRACM|nr:unnamed protein product [Brassica rapa]
MCTDGRPQTSYTHGQTQTATDVLCVLTDSHGRHVPKQSMGRASVLSPRTNPRTSCVC